MKTERFYPYLLVMSLGWMFVPAVISRLDWPFKLLSIAIFVVLTALILRVSFSRRRCGHGFVTMRGTFCYPWVPRECPKCGAKVW